MANTALTNPAAALAEAGRQSEIRSRLLFLVGALVVYRVGTFIPVPGINPDAVARYFNDQSNTILGIVNAFAEQAKVVLSGELKKPVTLKGIGATKGARAAITAAGGKFED